MPMWNVIVFLVFLVLILGGPMYLKGQMSESVAIGFLVVVGLVALGIALVLAGALVMFVGPGIGCLIAAAVGYLVGGLAGAAVGIVTVGVATISLIVVNEWC